MKVLSKLLYLLFRTTHPESTISSYIRKTIYKTVGAVNPNTALPDLPDISNLLNYYQIC